MSVLHITPMALGFDGAGSDVSSYESKCSVSLINFAIELMWLFQVRFPVNVVGVHLSAQADGEVDSEDIPVFGVCRCPGCHDFSL